MQPPTSDRLSADERRTVLLDVARELVVDVGPAGVTIGAVATRSEVTRALVYKHFANKDELLVELYRREAKRLDKQIRRTVEAAPDGFEAKLRAFVDATIDALDEHAPFFTPLRGVGTNPSARRDRRGWDSRSVTYFSELAGQEYALDPTVARPAIAILLAGVPALLTQVRSRPSQRAVVEQIYVDTVLGALARLSTR